jgi:acetyl-CoA synthetase
MEESEEFWAEQARQLDWFKTWDKVLEWEPPSPRSWLGHKVLPNGMR